MTIRHTVPSCTWIDSSIFYGSVNLSSKSTSVFREGELIAVEKYEMTKFCVVKRDLNCHREPCMIVDKNAP